MNAGSVQRYFVVPLSVQREGEDFLVGNAELEMFFQLPVEGVRILTMLGEDATIPAIEAAFAGGEAIDVADFVESMVALGLVYPVEQAHRHAERIAAAPADRRWTFRASPGVARGFVSPAAFVLYVLVVGSAILCMLRYPEARLRRDAFFIDDHFVATLVLLLVASSGTTALHELGHMVTAAARGVVSRLGFGMRLWFIVAEADLSGIMALPKRQRYLPLAAGMLVDVLNIALITLAVTALVRDGVHGFAVTLLQALALQLVVTLLWQFNIFLKTDVYFMLCTWFGHPDLDRDARAYLSALLARGSFGRLGRSDAGYAYRSLAMVRIFAAIWVIGRLISLAMLVLVVLPTLWRYAARAWAMFQDPAASRTSVVDIGTFAVLSLLFVTFGLVLWIRQRPRSAFGEEP